MARDIQEKPFAPACERNQVVILEQLKKYLKKARHVFEIGSGTGQHAVFFSANLPHLIWQTSDVISKHTGIQQWINDSQLISVKAPLIFDVSRDVICDLYDAVYTANTFHIMSWESVQLAIEKAATMLKKDGVFLVYGPFNKNGKFTSSSNQAFDEKLRTEDPSKGLRALEDVQHHAEKHHLALKDVIEMPANNYLLVAVKV